MVRSKVKLKFIEDRAARRVTYKKRVNGLVKKSEELKVLCDVGVCTIVYGPYNPTPVVWPSSESEVKKVLDAYRENLDLDPGQRKLNQEAYLRQSLTKADEKLTRLMRNSRERDMDLLRSDLHAGRPVEQVSYADVGDLLWVIDDKLRTLEHRTRNLVGQGPVNAAGNLVEPTQQVGPANPFQDQAGPSTQAGSSHQAGPSFPSQYQSQP